MYFGYASCGGGKSGRSKRHSCCRGRRGRWVSSGESTLPVGDPGGAGGHCDTAAGYDGRWGREVDVHEQARHAVARPRQVAMYLSKNLTSRSLPEIGRRFANRDHTTVIHAVKTITRLSEQDDEMKKNLNQIKSLLLEQ